MTQTGQICLLLLRRAKDLVGSGVPRGILGNRFSPCLWISSLLQSHLLLSNGQYSLFPMIDFFCLFLMKDSKWLFHWQLVIASDLLSLTEFDIVHKTC